MIVNPLTGERIRFLDEGTFEAWWPPRRRRTRRLSHVRITMTPPLRWREFIERLFATDPRDRRALAGLLAEFPDEIAGVAR